MYLPNKQVRFVNWEEYSRLKREEGLTDKKIAKVFGVSASTLSRLKKNR
ncbi:helix-turn-helix domain-containing protein [Clostridium niameyense]|uniref:Helix-turn-helix domain-containing protein n=1 Tax=Clostridium niameyense TaxID=1622073 RepID=A0A6M0REF6_9CLOT|nr:helix-turn-helix domain-containing protein [Clostridium niameyense]